MLKNVHSEKGHISWRRTVLLSDYCAEYFIFMLCDLTCALNKTNHY